MGSGQPREVGNKVGTMTRTVRELVCVQADCSSLERQSNDRGRASCVIGELDYTRDDAHLFTQWLNLALGHMELWTKLKTNGSFLPTRTEH